MKNKDNIILIKIQNYIMELKEFIAGYDYEKFSNDKKTINATVFNLSQIGELAGKISDKLTKEYTQIEWRGLKALRNRIVHDYDGINLKMIWGFLANDLDELYTQIEEIISELKNESAK